MLSPLEWTCVIALAGLAVSIAFNVGQRIAYKNLRNQCGKVLSPLQRALQAISAEAKRGLSSHAATHESAFNSILTSAQRGEETLQSFHGTEEKGTQMKNNPWKSGSFYVVAFLVLLVALAVGSHYVNLLILLPLVVAVLLGLSLIGALQLRNDDKLKDKPFTDLLLAFYQRLPLLVLRRKTDQTEGEQVGNKD